MIKITLSINNREETMTLPVTPPDIKVTSPQNNATVETVQYGSLKLIGNRGLKSLPIACYFPAEDALTYVHKLERWIKRKLPIRVIVTDDRKEIINLPMTIEGFEWGYKDGSKDIFYSLNLSEFKIIKLDVVNR